MLSTILFFVYFFLLWRLLSKMRFVRKSTLNSKVLFILFCFKILAGLAIGWLSLKYYPQGSDYWGLHQNGLEETDLLKHNPREFFTSLFESPYNHSSRFFGTTDSYWNDLKKNLIIKILGVLNLISNKNYYVNSLFFNAFGFLGHVALFRLFFKFYPKHKINIIIGAFLLPSMLYFSSGIHKDGIVFTLMALYSYSLIQFLYHSRKIHLLIAGITAIGIIFLRSHFFIALMPASVAIWLGVKKNISHAFLKTYLTAVLVFVILSFFPATNPIQLISERQAAFLELPTAKSQIPLNTLSPHIQSLIKNTPQAIVHAFAEPLPWRNAGSIIWFIGIEGWVYILFFILWCFVREKQSAQPLPGYSVFLVLPLFLFIGYIIPNTGSIVRYRATLYPYLLLPMLCTIKHISLKNMYLFIK